MAKSSMNFRAPKDYEYFICKNCKGPIMDEGHFDELSDIDSYFCSTCCDFVDVIAKRN